MKRLLAHLRLSMAAANEITLNAFGAFVFGVVIALSIVWETRDRFPAEAIYSILFLIPLIFTVAGASLAWSDATRTRIRDGYCPSAVSQLFFASGTLSVAVWFFLVLICGFPIAVLVGILSIVLA